MYLIASPDIVGKRSCHANTADVRSRETRHRETVGAAISLERQNDAATDFALECMTRIERDSEPAKVCRGSAGYGLSRFRQITTSMWYPLQDSNL